MSAERKSISKVGKSHVFVGSDEPLIEGVESSEDEIRAFCKGKIAHYKIPRYIKFVDEYPMTVKGKIQKLKMRDVSIAELGLQEDTGIETA